MHTIVLIYLACFTITSGSQIVTLPDGTQLRGTSDGSSIAFKGIPYAEAPLNELRWTPPQPYQNKDINTILDATNYGSICYQSRCYESDDDNSDSCSEDCLFLNVFINGIPDIASVKSSQNTSLLPVAFYIYGGTYLTGCSNDIDDGALMSYWGSNSAIIVSINYRLNVFGFLGSDELRSQDSIDGSTGNYGIQDQRMALKWVKENIIAFGGDPTRVSIFGESAGAGSVTQHLTRPKSYEYFNSVIMESGSFSVWSAMNMTSAEKVYKELNNNVGCSSSAESTDDISLSCLLSKTTEELFYASSLITSDPDGPYMLTYAPVVDGIEATTHPWISLANGNVADVPMIFGFNRDEGVAFTTLSTNATEEDVDAFWRSVGFQSDDEIAELHSLYLDNIEYPINPVGYSNYWWAASRSTGDIDFSCPSRYASHILSTLNTRNSFNQTYLYYFTHLTQGSDFVKHTYELAYVFQLLYLLPSQNDQDMSNVMSNFWGSFFITNDPNQLTFNDDEINSSISTLYWPPYTEDGDEILNIINATNMTVVSGLKKDVCDYFIPWLDSLVRRSFDSN